MLHYEIIHKYSYIYKQIYFYNKFYRANNDTKNPKYSYNQIGQIKLLQNLGRIAEWA